jgi:Ca2+:H+ antiporter
LNKQSQRWLLGKLIFWLLLLTVITPLLLIACSICYALVFTIPMARLSWALIKHLFQHPTSIRFCSAPAMISVSAPAETEGNASTGTSAFTIKSTRLSVGQLAPSGSPTSTVLLCIYKATGWQYYKYTIGGVNIFFINLMPVVFLVILDGMFLLPWVEHREKAGVHVPAFLNFLASRALIFILCLASVIPLSYFIGMAVASISAQSSIGMGAVINATFGSLIEVLLYSIALKNGKGRLVEGSIVGSLLAGVLLMPGMSMCGGAVRRKEQKFNAKSAGVTSMMLMMAFIGTLTPTLFYQTYGTVSFHPLLFTGAFFRVLTTYVRVTS